MIQDTNAHALGALSSGVLKPNVFAPQEFHYHLPWRAHGVHVGVHKTSRRGAGTDFAGYTSFLNHPDPKRVDMRASLRAMPRQPMVRAFSERASVKVYAVIDTSHSMRFVGDTHKLQCVAEIVASIAWSANRHGDAFGMLACDDAIQPDLTLLPSTRLDTARQAYAKLQSWLLAAQDYPSQPLSAQALPQTATQLSQQKSLVFLISDFHLPEPLIAQTLQAYATHDVVPVVLWDTAEYRNLPEWGLARVRDMETGAEQSFFMRPALKLRIQQQYQLRRAALVKLCHRYMARPPLFLERGFDAALFTRHLVEGRT